MRQKITKTVVDALAPGQTVWDTEVRGFGVRCQRSSKVYTLKAQVQGRTRWFPIGPHGSPWTPQAARIEATRILGQIAQGATSEQIRRGREGRKSVHDLAEAYMTEHAEPHKKPSSVKTDRANLTNHVIPLLGDRWIDEIKTPDIDKFLRQVANGKTAAPAGKRGNRGGNIPSGGTGVANRCRALLSTMFSHAEKNGWIPQNSNPVKHATKFKENAVERYLTPDETTRLGDALTAEEASNPHAVAAIRLLMLTGARLGEILTMRWEDIDEARSTAFLPDSKTGRRALHLSGAAMEVLSSIPKISGNPYVICGAKEGAHLVNIQKPWQRIRKKADIPDVRIHDLRHNFASAVAAKGYSLQIIGKLLGHKSVLTTQRYAHLTDSIVAEAGNMGAAEINSLSKRN